MTTASAIDPQLLIPFIQQSGEPTPTTEEAEDYIRRQSPTRKEAANLRRWQRAAEAGTVETEVCTNCWAISILDSGHTDEPVLLNACEGCQRSICNFCHVHVPGPEREKCQCGECSQNTKTVPNRYASVKDLIGTFVGHCRASAKTENDGRTLSAFLRRNPANPSDKAAIRQWQRESRKRDIYTLACPHCPLVAISRNQSNLAHQCNAE